MFARSSGDIAFSAFTLEVSRSIPVVHGMSRARSSGVYKAIVCGLVPPIGPRFFPPPRGSYVFLGRFAEARQKRRDILRVPSWPLRIPLFAVLQLLLEDFTRVGYPWLR